MHDARFFHCKFLIFDRVMYVVSDKRNISVIASRLTRASGAGPPAAASGRRTDPRMRAHPANVPRERRLADAERLAQHLHRLGRAVVEAVRVRGDPYSGELPVQLAPARVQQREGLELRRDQRVGPADRL